MPKVAVIMPAYNAEKYIAEAIDSILSQTYTDYEFIIINDCSKDRTEELILSYKDPRIVYLKNEENMGVAKTLNRGLAAARGEYIARMDSDDISMPQRFALQVAYLEENPDVAVVGTAVERFGTEIPNQIRSFSTDKEQMKLDLFFSCGLAHPSVMMRRAEVVALGGYDPEYNGMEDYELWCRVCGKYGVIALPEVLLRYRVHGSQVTRNPSPKLIVQMRALKARQLEELQLPINDELVETFYGYCTGNYPVNWENVVKLCLFLEKTQEANDRKNCYDQNRMLDTFRQVALNSTDDLRLSDALAICKKTKLLKPADVIICRMKKYVKALLKR